MRKLRIVIYCVIALPVLAGLAYYFFILDHENVPLCHKSAWLFVTYWFEKNPPGILPNADGKSAESLVQLRKGYDDDHWETAPIGKPSSPSTRRF